MGKRSAWEVFVPLGSPLHVWDPRPKLIGLGALIFAFAFVENVFLLPLMLGVTLSLFWISRLPLRFLLTRLRYPGVFLVMVTFLLPFFSGETIIWSWGPIALRAEGCWAAVLIGCRFLSILTLSLILLGCTPFLRVVKGLHSLGLPSILTDMMLLSYRYLSEISQDLYRMQQAMYLRGFGYHPSESELSMRKRIQNRVQDLKRLASLIGTLLIRSYERSERVYQAMRLRGYGLYPQPNATVRSMDKTWDWGASGAVVTLALGFILAQIFSFS